MKYLKLFISFLVVMILSGCIQTSDVVKTISINVPDSEVQLFLGEQIDWEGLYTATNETNEELTDLVVKNINDTTALDIGLHEVQLSLQSDGLEVFETITLNVILTDENILFSSPEDMFVFSVGDEISSSDFGVTAQTESGIDLTDRIEMIIYNGDSLQSGFHEALFRIYVSDSRYESVRVPFIVNAENTSFEWLSTFDSMTIEQYEVIENKVYILGYSEVGQDYFRDFIIYDMDNGDFQRMTEWGENLHGLGEHPQGLWTSFAIHNDKIYILGFETYVIDESLSGTDKYEYHTMLSIYNYDLSFDAKIELSGTIIDIPTNIAINESGYIAISGYNHDNYSSNQIAIFNDMYELVRIDYSASFKDMISDGDDFIIVGTESKGDYSSGDDGYVRKFNINGMIWEYRDQGYDMDNFIKITKTVDGYLILGETESYDSDQTYHVPIAYTVLLDRQGNLIEKHYYSDVHFPYQTLINAQNMTCLLGFDTATYHIFDSNESDEFRIPSIYVYNDNDELIHAYDIYIEQYVIAEQNIIATYNGELFAFVDLVYVQMSQDDVPQYIRGLFLIKISDNTG